MSKHYKGEIECVSVIEQQKLNFNLGNAMKYIFRAGQKEENNKEEDLYKALDYIHRELYGKWFHEK